jgi:hypothetical protein
VEQQKHEKTPSNHWPASSLKDFVCRTDFVISP